jgi:chemotaxis protein histidine kinase CheA
MTLNDELPDIFKNSATNLPLEDLEQKALDIIANMSQKYTEWTTNDVLKLKKLFEQIQNSSKKEQDELILGDFYRTAHDIKGQGATFDYPLMSDLGAHICTVIKSTNTFQKTHLTIFKQDIDDMSLVLEKQLSGDGGVIGKQISNRLKNG